MIIDTSALVAIIFEEAERQTMLDAMTSATSLQVSAATLFETCIVVDGVKDEVLSESLDSLVDDLAINAVSVTIKHVHLARLAYQRYGKGSGHPAKLNFGDCFSYALAIDFDEPLLFKGNDFSHTDVRIATTAPE